jgi:hypothetical protein
MIASQSREFLALHKEVTGLPAEDIFIKRHNHISVPLALGLGGDEEVWGDQLVQWIEAN